MELICDAIGTRFSATLRSFGSERRAPNLLKNCALMTWLSRLEREADLLAALEGSPWNAFLFQIFLTESGF